MVEPIFTSVKHLTQGHPMKFSLNAATEVTFTGDRYVHAYLASSFADSAGPNLGLVAASRQFSSFILVIGRIASATGQYTNTPMTNTSHIMYRNARTRSFTHAHTLTHSPTHSFTH